MRHRQAPPCFLLLQVGVGEVRRAPADACRTRVSPQSTFKIPHALAALDAGIVRDASSSFPYDGTPHPFESWKRDHTLATAMRSSVVWWFQRVARELGPAREREYLHRFNYGNADSTSGLTTFWLGGSLAISPEEQSEFLLKSVRQHPAGQRSCHAHGARGARPATGPRRQCEPANIGSSAPGQPARWSARKPEAATRRTAARSDGWSATSAAMARRGCSSAA